MCIIYLTVNINCNKIMNSQVNYLVCPDWIITFFLVMAPFSKTFKNILKRRNFISKSRQLFNEEAYFKGYVILQEHISYTRCVLSLANCEGVKFSSDKNIYVYWFLKINIDPKVEGFFWRYVKYWWNFRIIVPNIWFLCDTESHMTHREIFSIDVNNLSLQT